MVIGDNGQVYYYYSTIRPADYYTNYWFVMPTLNCTDENDIKKANSGEKPQDFIKPGGYDAIEKYFYKNGIYYYLPLASQTGWYQTQELSSKVVSDNNLELVTINGKKYFKGTFNGTDYEFVEKAGNKIKNVEVENGQITSATLNGYDFSDSLTVTQPEQFAYIGANVSVSGVKGYDYFDTVYLTLDGKPDESGSSAIATYTYRGDVGVNAPTGNIGYDYIVKDYQKSNQDDNGMYLYNEGIFISLTEEEVEKGKTQGGIEITAENRYSKDEKYTLTSAYFTLTNTSATEENTSALTTPTKDMTDKTISYTLYPGALINPYAVDANANNTKRTEKTYANISSSLFDGGVIPSVTIQEDITYFYYEGGYITDLDLGAGVDGKATKVYTLVCDSDKKYNGEDISTQKITLYKYDKDTKDNVNTSNINEQVTAEFVTISQLYAGLSGTYYIIDVSDPSYKSYLEETDDTKNPLAVYKVSNYYKTHTDGCLYKLDDMYFIGGDAMGGDYEGTTSGMVYKYYTYASAKTQDSFMYNKYLTNTNFKLYTAHVFTDLHGNKIDFSTPLTDSEGNKIWYFVIDGNNYHLLPDSDKFTGNPNTPTTYFAESCKVTLGGGLTLTHTGVGGSVESGTITIE